MKDQKNAFNRRAFWLLLLLIPLALSACAGTRTPSTSWPGITVNQGVAYIANNQAIYAVDVEDGRELWRYLPQEDEATSFYAAPAVDDEAGLVFAGSFDGNVVALEAASGNVRWRQTLEGARVVGGPTLGDDLLLVPSADRNLYALRLDSGQQVWSFQSERAFWSSPRVEGDDLYLAGLDHVLYKLRTSDGNLIWERELSGALADQPASFDGLLLVGTFGEELMAVEKDTGQIAWAVETGDWVWGNPGVAGDMAYFGDVAGDFYAVNQSGSTVWNFNVDGQIAASPVLDETNVYFVTEGGSVFARTANDNSPQWEQSVEGRLLSDPALVDETLIVATVDGENLLTAFDVTSGAIRWTYQPVEE